MGELAPASRRVHLCVRICAPESWLGVWLQLRISPVLGFVLCGRWAVLHPHIPASGSPPHMSSKPGLGAMYPGTPSDLGGSTRPPAACHCLRWQEQPEGTLGPDFSHRPTYFKKNKDCLLEHQLTLFSGFYIFFPLFLFVVFCPHK